MSSTERRTSFFAKQQLFLSLFILPNWKTTNVNANFLSTAQFADVSLQLVRLPNKHFVGSIYLTALKCENGDFCCSEMDESFPLDVRAEVSADNYVPRFAWNKFFELKIIFDRIWLQKV